jgi:hypothetical protein
MKVYMPQKNKKNTTVAFTSVLCGCAFFLISYFVRGYAGVVQLAALAFWVFGMWVACRYSLTSYYYAVDGDNFVVVKTSGKNNQTVCNISMRTGEYFGKLSESKKIKSVRNRFDYSSNFRSEQRYVYMFEWNGTSAEIIFEADEAFASIVADKLKELKSSAEKKDPTNGWYDE